MPFRSAAFHKGVITSKRILERSLELGHGLGCMRLIWSRHSGRDKAGMMALIRAAVGTRVIFFDTAEVYDVVNESCGRALAPMRDQVVIATIRVQIAPKRSHPVGLTATGVHKESVRAR